MLLNLITSFIFLDVINGDLYNYEYAELGDLFEDDYSVDYNSLPADPGRVRRIPAEDFVVQTRSDLEIKDAFERIVSEHNVLNNFTSQVSHQHKETQKEQQATIKVIPILQHYFEEDYTNLLNGFDEPLIPNVVHIDTWSTDPITSEAPRRLKEPLSTTEVDYETETATEDAYYYYVTDTVVENLPETSKALVPPEKTKLHKSEIYVQVPRISFADVPIRAPNLPSRSPDLPFISRNLLNTSPALPYMLLDLLQSPVSPKRSSSDLQIVSSVITESSLYEYETYVQNPDPFYMHVPDTSADFLINSTSHVESTKNNYEIHEYESYVQNPQRLHIDAPERSLTSYLSTLNYSVNKSYVQNIRTSDHPPDKSPTLLNRSTPHAPNRSPELETEETQYIFESFIQNPRRWMMTMTEKSTKLPNRLSSYAPNKKPELNSEEMSIHRYESYNLSPRISSLISLEGTPKLPNRSSPQIPDRTPELKAQEKSLNNYMSHLQTPKASSLLPLERSPKLPQRSSPQILNRSPEFKSEEKSLYNYMSHVQSPGKSSLRPPERSSKLPNRSSPELPNRSPEKSLYNYMPHLQNPRKTSFLSLERSPNLPLRSSTQLPERSPKPDQEEIVLYKYETNNDSLQRSSFDPPRRSLKLPNKSLPRVLDRSPMLRPEELSLYRYETHNSKNLKYVQPPKVPSRPSLATNISQKPEELSIYRYESGHRQFKSSLNPEISPKLQNKSSKHSHNRFSAIRPEEQSLQGNESIYIKKLRMPIASDRLPKISLADIANRSKDTTNQQLELTTRLLDLIPDVKFKSNEQNLPELQDNMIGTDEEDGKKGGDYFQDILLRRIAAGNKSETDDVQEVSTAINILRQNIQNVTNSSTTDTTTTTTGTTATPTTTVIRYDIARFLAIIANLTYDYDTNLTMQVNYTLTKLRWPTCGTPAPPTTTTTTPPPPMDYSGFNGSLIAKCFVCGLETEQIPYEASCADAFAGDFIPLVPQDPRARSRVARYRKYCRLGNVRNFHINATYPRAIYGEWTGGCAVRWSDVTGVYTQRTCRNRLRPTTGRHFASKRMAKLERALLHEENGCIISPVASLLPLSRGISLFSRIHACVCTGSWCNTAPRLHGACVARALLLVAIARMSL